jgi:hypothetical protein
LKRVLFNYQQMGNIMIARLVLVIILCIPTALTLSAQIPKQISYQGLLTTSSGAPAQSGTYSLTLSLWDALQNGNELWSESHGSVNVVNGVFTILLGSSTQLNLPFNSPYFISVTVESGPGIAGPVTFTPRTQLSAVAYAFRSDSANAARPVGVAGGDLSGSYPNPAIAANAITSAKVLNGTLQAVDIAGSQVVKSINGLKDSVTLIAGNNISVTPSGNNLTIASSAGGVSGSGTVNYVPVLTGSTAIGNSVLYQNLGNIGLGTTSPAEKLSVASNPGYGISHEASGIKLSTYIDGSSGYFGTVSDHPLQFYTNNGAGQITLLQNGFVGIGNTNPQYKLDVIGRMRVRTGAVGNPFTSSGLWLDDYTDGSTRIFFGMQDSIRLGIWGDGTPSVGWGFNFNARNGNVGIGVSSPADKLAVGGNITSTGNITSNGNVSGNSFRYNSPKTFYYSVPPAAFTSTWYQDSDVANAWHIFTEYNGESTVHTDIGGGLAFVAPVYLPDGATVTGMTVYGFSGIDIQVTLRRRLHEGDAYISMCSVNTGVSGDFESSSSSVSFPVISNQYYNFTIHVSSLSSVQKIRSVRISYTMPEAQ